MTEYENNRQKFLEFRKLFPVFCFNEFEYKVLEDGSLETKFHFSCSEHEFCPTQIFSKEHNPLIQQFGEEIENFVFHIGLVELVSYWKAFASPVIKIRCGAINDKQAAFFKKLYWNGLGEYFYLNGIVGFDGEKDLVDIDNFVDIQCESKKQFCKSSNLSLDSQEFIVPIGGGKDSVVSLELLRSKGKTIIPFAINARGAIKDCLKVAGLPNYYEVKRSIDKHLIELNQQGFLNGHTPFSAIVAFSSLLSAFLTKRKFIALSNESSANESTVKGMSINHQYSKGIEFENDFRAYYKEFLAEDFEYFSLLRPISELRIAEIFSHLPYLPVFKSCNAGSKQDIWCGKCPKCLFAFIILSPFIAPDELECTFGKNLFADKDLLKELRELDGEAELKPFECVGTINEVNIALSLRVRNFEVKQEDVLLNYWLNSSVAKDYIGKDFTEFFKEENKENNLPEDLKNIFTNTYAQTKKAEIARLLGNKRIGIMGFGREGKSTYKLLKEIFPNKSFVLFDQNAKAFDETKEEIIKSKEKIFISKEEFAEINSLCDIIFLTPGITLKDLKDIDLDKISNQCDLFLSLYKNQTIGISGTKGKSTTTSLVYEIIKSQHDNTIIAGNIGIPVFDIIDKVKQDSIIVLELSCHQLQNIKMAPKVSVLLNLYQEHLDHYNSYEEYQLAKLNLLLKGEKTDTFIYCKDSSELCSWVEKYGLQRIYKGFSATDYIFDSPKHLKGEHNKLNILASLYAVESFMGCKEFNQEKALASALNFKGLPHRLQFVARINEVDYYNDSISTIPQATLAAMKSLGNVSALILGGMDRGIDYNDIKKILDYNTETNKLHIAFVGSAGRRMKQILEEENKNFDSIVSDDWNEIIDWVKQKAEKGKSVLLSPAASSYDQFKNFEFRGKKFEELVLKANN